MKGVMGQRRSGEACKMEVEKVRMYHGSTGGGVVGEDSSALHADSSEQDQRAEGERDGLHAEG
jgi:hypothetical protein